MEATIGAALIGTSIVLTMIAKKMVDGKPLGNTGMILSPALVAGFALGLLFLVDGLR